MLTVGDRFPEFRLPAVVSLERGGEFAEFTHESFEGRWKVYFFWPMDFTFVCPTELAEFGRRHGDFRARETKVVGCSTDTQFVHLAWRKSDEDLRDLPYPMLSDTKRELTGALGILHREEGVALRATFLVDPGGIIRHVSVNDLSVGRSVEEILRVLDALQTDELCPCNWHPGDPTLDEDGRPRASSRPQEKARPPATASS